MKWGFYVSLNILSVILNIESDSGLPVAPMNQTDGKQVGSAIDMTVNLGNSSNSNVNDATQGYAIWTVENSSMGSNWVLTAPNMYGKHPNEVSLCHG
jgi:hypothetical protein